MTTVGPEHSGHYTPQFLPDGRHFLYYVMGSPDANGVYIGDLTSSETRHVLKTESAAVYASSSLLYLRQGELVAQPFDPDRLTTTGNAVVLARGVARLPSRPSMAGRSSFARLQEAVAVRHTSPGSADRARKSPKSGSRLQGLAARRRCRPTAVTWRTCASSLQARQTSGCSRRTAACSSGSRSRRATTSRPSGLLTAGASSSRRTGGIAPQSICTRNAWRAPRAASNCSWPATKARTRLTGRDGNYLLYSSVDPKSSSDIWA